MLLINFSVMWNTLICGWRFELAINITMHFQDFIVSISFRIDWEKYLLVTGSTEWVINSWMYEDFYRNLDLHFLKGLTDSTHLALIIGTMFIHTEISIAIEMTSYSQNSFSVGEL